VSAGWRGMCSNCADRASVGLMYAVSAQIFSGVPPAS